MARWRPTLLSVCVQVPQLTFLPSDKQPDSIFRFPNRPALCHPGTLHVPFCFLAHSGPALSSGQLLLICEALA